MNRNLILSASAISFVVLSMGSIGYMQSKPDYVQMLLLDCSYLSSYYGPTECSGAVSNEHQWSIKCNIKDKGKSFTYSVLPSEMAPYPVARSFIKSK
jgi:hypothetical protein